MEIPQEIKSHQISKYYKINCCYFGEFFNLHKWVKFIVHRDLRYFKLSLDNQKRKEVLGGLVY